MEDNQPPPKPRFKFGDTVAVLDDGFYGGCYGRVTSYHVWFNEVSYEVDLFCKSRDAKYGKGVTGSFRERDLVEDVSEH